MIDRKTIESVARLARLEINDLEAEELATHLAKAIQHFDAIAKVKTDGVEPLITPIEIKAYYREDVVVKDFTAEEMTENAPEKAGNLFKVPPVV